MNRLLTFLLLVICFGSTAFAQPGGGAGKDKALQKAAENGKQLATQITVHNNVTAQAVLIPQVDARRIFGKEIADNYAVIEVNVGNKSPDAALIIHGIFIDYSRWGMSGATNDAPMTVDGAVRDDSRFEAFQASTNTSHVASEEYRVVRGQLLNAQMYSKRNWTMRLLTLAGNLASAYAFSIGEEGIIRGLNAFSGSVVPGLREAWPDGTIDQLNRVSDFGYQANKVIGKQNAEVIVCFFPIDRFLTPGFRKLFLKSPALFFAPNLMLVDKTLRKETDDLLKRMDSTLNLEELRRSLPCYMRIVKEMRGLGASADEYSEQINQLSLGTCESFFGLQKQVTDDVTHIAVKNDGESRGRFKNFLALDFLSQMSLNSVTVKIDGVMTVDTTTIAAKIDGVTFDKVANCGDDKSPCFWSNTAIAGGARTGTIHGSYLTGGNVVIDEATALGITEVKTITEGASDQVVNFSIKLTKPVAPGQSLHFRISKPQPGSEGANAKTIDSLTWEYPVGYTPVAPSVTDVKQEGKKLTIKGTGFFNVPPDSALVVKLHPPIGDDIEVTPSSATPTQLEVTIPDDAEPAGCWTVAVNVGALPAPRSQTDCFCFVVEPKPELESAVRKDNTQIILTGTDLIDTRLCGGPKLSFQLQKEGGTPSAAKILGLDTLGRLVLALPPAAKDGSWTVQVLLGGEKKGDPVKLE